MKQQEQKVWFVGAGPGDPELITVKGKDLISVADAILFTGSLVSGTVMRWSKSGCEIADSKGMTLEDINHWLIDKAQTKKIVVRLQTGDPSLYGALIEMIQALDKHAIASSIIPGVSSALASAAAACETLTLPELTQTVIFTRIEGRTPMPEGESLEELASHHSSICLFLSITLIHKVENSLIKAGWSKDSPIVVVHKASWPGEEKIVRGTLSTIREKCKQAGITSQSMIIVSPTLGARNFKDLKKSRLYAADFNHKFRINNIKKGVSL
ncbi:MAG: precorrin-4 C(11)-methyltransferase [Pseudomonadota bacterium]